MMSSLKKSFVIQFLFYFSLVLIVLGVIQSIFGTMRFYNSSEQDYEKLSPQKIFTKDITSLDDPQTIEEEMVPGNTSTFEDNKSNSLQEVWKELPQEKIQIIEQQYSEKKALKKKKETTEQNSPVEISVTPRDESMPKGYKETIWTVVTGRYFRDTLWDFPIVVDVERVEPRGQMYNESITLSSSMASLPEVSKVLVHEIGHMIDIYTFRKSIKKSDLSEDFYKISWKDTTTIKPGISQSSFVSGYASTNQYEDFAESFTMYIFHNKEFLKRAEQNSSLKQKYSFFKTRVFGDDFVASSYEKSPIPKKVWDVTKIAIRGNNIDTIFAWLNTLRTYKS